MIDVEGMEKRWYAGPNYIVGGYWVFTDQHNPESSVVIDLFFDEPTADHVAALHNAWLSDFDFWEQNSNRWEKRAIASQKVALAKQEKIDMLQREIAALKTQLDLKELA